MTNLPNLLQGNLPGLSRLRKLKLLLRGGSCLYNPLMKMVLPFLHTRSPRRQSHHRLALLMILRWSRLFFRLKGCLRAKILQPLRAQVHYLYLYLKFCHINSLYHANFLIGRWSSKRHLHFHWSSPTRQASALFNPPSDEEESSEDKEPDIGMETNVRLVGQISKARANMFDMDTWQNVLTRIYALVSLDDKHAFDKWNHFR